MSEYISINQAAEQWGISRVRVTKLCQEGRIEGAVRKGRFWRIPENASKPADLRTRSGKQSEQTRSLLPMPIGISDYKTASTQYYYVDKTLMIKDFLDEKPAVSLFTRPRRFGKTLNMDMLKTFFEITDEDTSLYFKDKAIWDCGTEYTKHQGKYPVIFLTFKDVKYNTWELTLRKISDLLSKEFLRHSELADSAKCNDREKKYYNKIADSNADLIDLSGALGSLSAMLKKHFGIAPVLIIDEYDTPIQQGYMYGFYDEAILFMRNFFSEGLKDNNDLSFGFLTGILRVAKESIFSGMNNLSVNSVLDNKYSRYFGFTKDEINEMTAAYSVTDKLDEICEWYDGYVFGEQEIFNPWSVINYFSNGCQPKAFWVSTGDNSIIEEILEQADSELYDNLNSLISGGKITSYIDTNVIYPEIRQNPSSIYSFLLITGYLKYTRKDIANGNDYMCELELPNREIRYAYKKEILDKMADVFPQNLTIPIQEAIYKKDADKLKDLLCRIMINSISSFDHADETFYHGMILGLLITFESGYRLTSNRESGLGRFDIQLMPKDSKLPGVLMELKATKDKKDDLSSLAKTALKQIDEKKYDTEMKEDGVKDIIKIGIAFCGKTAEVEVE